MPTLLNVVVSVVPHSLVTLTFPPRSPQQTWYQWVFWTIIVLLLQLFYRDYGTPLCCLGYHQADLQYSCKCSPSIFGSFLHHASREESSTNMASTHISILLSCCILISHEKCFWIPQRRECPVHVCGSLLQWALVGQIQVLWQLFPSLVCPNPPEDVTSCTQWFMLSLICARFYTKWLLACSLKNESLLPLSKLYWLCNTLTEKKSRHLGIHGTLTTILLI